MSGHSPEEIRKSVKSYMVVFGILIIGTIVTVLASYFDFGSMTANIIVALIIATFKASCVALIFMHLNAEKKTIYMTLAFTWFFFMGLMGLTIWASEDKPNFTVAPNDIPAVAAAPAETDH
jgi:caa(3)-type oxidase subunit IV